MATRNDSINNCILRFLNAVQKRYLVERAYIFGSYAKGTAKKWSDIDLAIISKDFSDDTFEDKLYLMKLAIQFDDRIEPMPYHPAAFNPNDPLVAEIQKTGIQIM